MQKKLIKNNKIVWMILIGCGILITIFCLIKIIIPNKQYTYYGEHDFTEGIIESERIIYDNIILPPGIYDVILEYESETSLMNLCTITDGTVYHNGLLTNGETLHTFLKTTDFRMWLFESTEALRVNISYGGEGYLKTGEITFKETNFLWILILVITWSLVATIVGFKIFLLYDNRVRVSKEKKTVIFGVFAIVLISSLPYLQGGGMNGADYIYHLERIEGVKDGILSGQFPLRIEPSWLFGHGYANSIFYCNTFLYFPAILRLLGFTVTTSYNLYCISLNLVTAIIAYICFSKIFKNRYIGLLCSALYTLSVFRIYKLVITAALGEGSAVTFMPLILYGLYRVFFEDVKEKSYKKTWIPIAFGYAGLIQTHVLSCEITAFLTILICVVFVKKIFVKERFLELLKGASAATAMSFWYLVPFLDYYINEDMHIKHVSARTIQDRGLYIPQLFFNWWKLGNNSLSGDEGMVGSHAMGVGAILGLAFIIFLALWYTGKLHKLQGKQIALGKISCALAGMLMFMSLNIFPWDWLQHKSELTAPLISSLQFPNRFLGWGTVFLVILYGCILWFFNKAGKKWCYYLAFVGALVGISTSSIYLLDHVCKDKTYFDIYNEEGMGFGYISGAEYLIEGTQLELLDFGIPAPSENVNIKSYSKEYLHMWVDCVNDGSDAEYIELPMLHYNGYRAYISEAKVELDTYKGTNNLVRVYLPENFSGEIEIKFVSPIAWRIGEIVTYAYWILIIFLIAQNRMIKRRERMGVC